jgi:hypothetical protein
MLSGELKPGRSPINTTTALAPSSSDTSQQIRHLGDETRAQFSGWPEHQHRRLAVSFAG